MGKVQLKFFDTERQEYIGLDHHQENHELTQVNYYEGLYLVSDEYEDEDGYPAQFAGEFLLGSRKLDKHGKEIFAGDVIKYAVYTPFGKSEHVEEVRYEEKECAFKAGLDFLGRLDSAQTEIIGNLTTPALGQGYGKRIAEEGNHAETNEA